MNWENRLHKRLRDGNLRQLRTTNSNIIDFSSNDYLGLAKSQILEESVAKDLSKNKHLSNGLGSTGSRLLSGNSSYAEKLENKIAHLHGYEASLLFNCGYMANLGLLSSVASYEDTILYDIDIHASTHDGIRLSRAKAYPFRHNDVVHLTHRLKSAKLSGNKFICVESIYSVDGSLAPLKKISELAQQYGAHLIVDEAHALGVYGPNGLGVVAKENLESQIFAQVNTFGKGLGVQGAAILGSTLLREILINFATPFIYTTALPLHNLAAISCSYDLFPKLNVERLHLQSLIKNFENYTSNISRTHIQSIYFEGNKNVKKASKQLIEQGFDVRSLTSPTVKRGNELLRVCLHAFNTESEVKDLLTILKLIKGKIHV